MYDRCAVIDGGSASRRSNPFRADLNPDLVPKSANWSGRALHRTSWTLNLDLLTCNTLLRFLLLFTLCAMSSHPIIGDSLDTLHPRGKCWLCLIQTTIPTQQHLHSNYTQNINLPLARCKFRHNPQHQLPHTRIGKITPSIPKQLPYSVNTRQTRRWL